MVIIDEKFIFIDFFIFLLIFFNKMKKIRNINLIFGNFIYLIIIFLVIYI